MSDLDDAVRAFVAETVLPQVEAWDRADDLPHAVLEQLVALGVTGALVPREHGGGGLGMTEMAPVWRTLSHGWISLTGAINPTGLATALLVRHGTDAQRERWLPAIARGAVLASFSITEPQAGSDLGRIETTARVRERGGLVLDGEKRWVAGGVSSEVVFMLAEIDGEPSCVVLPADGRGSASWEVDELDKVGYRGVESAAYRFHAHEAPGAEVLGDAPGEGARQMLDSLDVGRVNVACGAVGIIDRALDCAVEEAVAVAARLAASRSYAAGDELARLRRDAPQTQIGEGANDALLLALARPLLRG